MNQPTYKVDLDENIACLTENREILRKTIFTNKKYRCYVSHVESPFLFWIHLHADLEVITAMDEKITRFYNDPVNNEMYKLQTVVENYYYAARFSVNFEWYRAKVLKMNDKKVTVFYIDYGNTETLSIGQLRILAGEFYKTIAQAKPMSLSNAYPVSPNKEWHSLEIKYFYDLVLDRFCLIDLKDVASNWPIHFCRLSVPKDLDDLSLKIDALQYLVNENIASNKANVKIIADFKIQFEEKVALYLKTLTLKITRQKVDFSVSYKDFSTSYDEIDTNKIILDGEGCFKFTLVYVNDPSDFYINNKNSRTDQLFFQLEENIFKYYSENESRLLNSPGRIDFLRQSTLCIVKNPINKAFYRAGILSHNTNDHSINIFSIDYGFSTSVHISDAFPFLKKFCYLPPYCISCGLQSTTPNIKDVWSSTDIDKFNELALLGHSYKGKACTVISRKLIELAKPGMIECSLDKKIGLFFHGENNVLINTAMSKLNPFSANFQPSIAKYNIPFRTKKILSIKPDNTLPKEDKEFENKQIKQYAGYQANHTQSFENSKEPKEDLHELDINISLERITRQNLNNDQQKPLENNKESFDSKSKLYELENETNEVTEICLKYRKYGKCHRTRCPFIHQKSKKNEETKPIFSDVFNSNKFVKDDLLLVNLVSFKERLNFHAIVLGLFDKELKQFVKFKNMKELDSKINNYYNNIMRKKIVTFYKVGQIVAARSKQLKNKWFRAKVVEIYKDDDLDKTLVNVFLLDIGVTKKVNLQDIHPINKSFCSQPIQLIEFNLAYTNIKPNDMHNCEVSKLVGKNGLCLANVIGSTAGLFELVLYTCNFGYTINESLVSSDQWRIKS